MNNPINISLNSNDVITATIEQDRDIGVNIDRNAGGLRSYPPLAEKPSINDVTLLGNKTSEDLHLQEEMDALSIQEIERILYLDN